MLQSLKGSNICQYLPNAIDQASCLQKRFILLVQLNKNLLTLKSLFILYPLKKMESKFLWSLVYIRGLLYLRKNIKT